MSRLHDALEACLSGLDGGQGLDEVLALQSAYAAELRPLLETAIRARAAGKVAVSAESLQRGRARLLQRRLELRNARGGSRSRYIPVGPRVAITLGLVAVLVLTSTGLVSASSGSLPGDQLYSVKRTWEHVQLFLVPPTPERELLESRFEQERLDEIGELLGKRRAAPITFAGLVMRQQDGRWLVSGIGVSITAATDLPARPIAVGEPVMITGLTSGDSTVEAQRVRLLGRGASLPPLEPLGFDAETDDSGFGQTDLGHQSTTVPQASGSYQFSGIIESMKAGAWRINGQPVYADEARIVGSVKVGSAVKFEGYYSADGRFVVTELQVELTPAQQRANPAERSGTESGRSGDGGGENNGNDGGEDDAGGGDD